jgi:hypothetical protein
MPHKSFSTKRRRTTPSLRPFLTVASLVLLGLCPAPGAAQTTLPSTPQELLESDPHVFATTLKTSWPQAVSLAHKKELLASLPVEGVVTELSVKLQLKLAALDALLRAVDRDAVYDVRVVDISMARIGLWERSALLISAPALALLSAEELRAQVAHEIGHEYFVADRDRATTALDHRRLKELEFMCDAIGMVILHELGMDPSRLIASVDKVTLYNRRTSHIGMDEANYPTLDERRQFGSAVRRWMRGR